MYRGRKSACITVTVLLLLPDVYMPCGYTPLEGLMTREETFWHTAAFVKQGSLMLLLQCLGYSRHTYVHML